MIHLITLYTGADGASHVQRSKLADSAAGADRATPWEACTLVRFEESPPRSSLTWHDAPQRQYVITLSGRLEFTTRDGERFELGPGDVLLAEDTAGSGHQWRLIDDEPWRRLYVQLEPKNPPG